MEFGKEQLNEALTLLAERLEVAKCNPVHMVVSGGSALLARDIVSRHTHDIDVLAMRGEIDGELMPAWPLPEYAKKYAGFIATTKHLDPDWLNATTSLMVIRLENFPREVWTGLVTE